MSSSSRSSRRASYAHTLTLVMDNTWMVDLTTANEQINEHVIKGAHREKDRRVRALETVKYFKTELSQIYTPRVALEYMSALFRQRGVPSLDEFTSSLVGSFRSGFGFAPSVEGTVRKIMSVSRWSSAESSVTMWTIEPVVSTVIVKGNSLDMSAAKARFSPMINVVEAMTMSTNNTIVVNNEIKGRWGGWLAWKESEYTGSGAPSCVHCNLSGSSIMFMVRHRTRGVSNLIMTPESVVVLSAYSRAVCASMDMSSSLIASSSTKLKIQPPLSTSRSTSLSVYGNGSVQICGSPLDVENVVKCLHATLLKVMDTEMVPFLQTMRCTSTDSMMF